MDVSPTFADTRTPHCLFDSENHGFIFPLKKLLKRGLDEGDVENSLDLVKHIYMNAHHLIPYNFDAFIVVFQ